MEVAFRSMKCLMGNYALCNAQVLPTLHESLNLPEMGALRGFTPSSTILDLHFWGWVWVGKLGTPQALSYRAGLGWLQWKWEEVARVKYLGAAWTCW